MVQKLVAPIVITSERGWGFKAVSASSGKRGARAGSAEHRHKQHPSRLALPPDASDIKVRLCDREGKYLAAAGSGWSFSTDSNRALVADYLGDRIEQYVQLIARVGGPVLKPVPVDPGEVLELCDQCHKMVESSDAFFDGRRFVCPQCRAGR